MTPQEIKKEIMEEYRRFYPELLSEADKEPLNATSVGVFSAHTANHVTPTNH